ncbi:unnamed protein product [Larinioides sclopetarius]
MGTDGTCDIPSDEACNIPREVQGIEIPQTAEDVNRLCLETSQCLNCLKDYADKCGYKNVHQLFTEDFYQSLKDLVKNVCQNESRLHSTLVENISCISESQEQFEDDCGEDLSDKLETLKEYIRKERIEETHDDPNFTMELWMRMNCVTQSLAVSCFSSLVSRKCGMNARDAVVEVVARSKGLKQTCPPVIGEEINELLRVLNLGTEEQRLLAEIM